MVSHLRRRSLASLRGMEAGEMSDDLRTVINAMTPAPWEVGEVDDAATVRAQPVMVGGGPVGMHRKRRTPHPRPHLPPPRRSPRG